MKLIAGVVALLLYVAGTIFLAVSTKGTAMRYLIELNGVRLERRYATVLQATDHIDRTKIEAHVVAVLDTEQGFRYNVKPSAYLNAIELEQVAP